MNHIINPIDGVKYSLFSEIGKNIFKKYLNAFKSGGSELTATQIGPTKVRISSSSPVPSSDMDVDVEDVDVTFGDIEDDVANLFSSVKNLNNFSDRRLHFEDEAARVTRPTDTYSQRYDNFNNKINKSWENHMNNRMSYLNYSIDMGFITKDKIKKVTNDLNYAIDMGFITEDDIIRFLNEGKEVRPPTLDELALLFAEYYFNNGEWLDNSAIEYYGSDYAWYFSPIYRSHSPPPENIENFDDTLPDLKLTESALPPPPPLIGGAIPPPPPLTPTPPPHLLLTRDTRIDEDDAGINVQGDIVSLPADNRNWGINIHDNVTREHNVNILQGLYDARDRDIQRQREIRRREGSSLYILNGGALPPPPPDFDSLESDVQEPINRFRSHSFSETDPAVSSPLRDYIVSEPNTGLTRSYRPELTLEQKAKDMNEFLDAYLKRYYSSRTSSPAIASPAPSPIPVDNIIQPVPIRPFKRKKLDEIEAEESVEPVRRSKRKRKKPTIIDV